MRGATKRSDDLTRERPLGGGSTVARQAISLIAGVFKRLSFWKAMCLVVLATLLNYLLGAVRDDPELETAALVLVVAAAVCVDMIPGEHDAFGIVIEGLIKTVYVVLGFTAAFLVAIRADLTVGSAAAVLAVGLVAYAAFSVGGFVRTVRAASTEPTDTQRIPPQGSAR